MRIGIRLTIALLVAAIVPLLLVGIWSLYTLQQASESATEQSEAALTQLGETAILKSAESVAQQVDQYLAAHPELDWRDAAQFEANSEMAKIAVQPVGETGYTALFDQEAVTHFHENPELIGVDLGTLAEKLPEFWAILSASLDGTPSAGYYDWEDADGRIRPKYMSIVPVGNTGLRVAATTYIDEFSRPVVQVQTALDAVRNRARTQLIVVLMVVAGIATFGAVMFSRRICRPINRITKAASQIAAGDLSAGTSMARPPSAGAAASDRDELGLLARAFGQMANSLISVINQVKTLTLNLSSASGQVMMTQRRHAANSEEQAAAVTSASVAAEELASTSAQIAETTQRVVVAANQTQSNAQQGVGAMNETAKRLQQIAADNDAAVVRVRELGNLAREIEMVMDLIEDIADQTKMIAFNASIEASAAGEAGRRFSVVSAEVRRLADSVAQSAEEIRSKVEQIQTTTNELVIASERESKEIEAGLALGETMQDLLHQILHSAEQTALAVRQISNSTQEQKRATEQLQQDLGPLADGARSVASGSKETVVVMEDLVVMARDLEQAINRFNLSQGA